MLWTLMEKRPLKMRMKTKRVSLRPITHRISKPILTPILLLPILTARAQREAFQRKRNQHYGNEAEALRVAKALAAQDDEEEEEEEEREIPPVPSLNGVTK